MNKRAAVAIGVDGLAIDVFHHQIRRAVFEIAAVDQSRDRRVGQRCENVPLAVQPAAQPRVQGRVVQHLDGDRLLVLRVVPLAAIHRAHAAVPENRHDPIVSDTGPDQPVLVLHQQRFRRFADRVQQGILRYFHRRPRAIRPNVAAPHHRRRRSPIALARSLGAGVDHLLEERLNLLPASARNHVER